MCQMHCVASSIWLLPLTEHSLLDSWAWTGSAWRCCSSPPDYRGQGLGARLLRDGIANYNVNELTVNEQNPQAFAFYEHMGFHTVSRSELDEQGNPFPILTMRLD